VKEVARLKATLGHPALRRLVERLRGRMERGEGWEGVVRLDNPSAEERDALASLLGRPLGGGGSMSVNLEQLRVVVEKACGADNLGDAVELLVGRVTDKRAAREREAQAWECVWQEAREGVVDDVGRAWLEDLRSKGIVKRLCAGAEEGVSCLRMAVEVARRLPGRNVTLAQLAVEVTGTAHGLDPRTTLGAVCLRFVERVSGVEDKGAAGRRAAWAGVGVICDELSSTVLVLNVVGDDGTLTGRMMRDAASEGEPVCVTARQLTRRPPSFSSLEGVVVSVCENPSIVAAAADAWGVACAPLVCVEGQPNGAVRTLLDGLVAAGASLRYHGDFDWAGIQIANLVMRRHGATPWRMMTSDYLEAAGGTSLEGAPRAATWDPGLVDAMARRGVAVHEEMVAGRLLADLGQGP
jgi:uncharacterized protein (TIGR02679 family)